MRRAWYFEIIEAVMLLISIPLFIFTVDAIGRLLKRLCKRE